MTLERTYRRLLACYPREHRREYGEEMLGVLLADAGPQRTRPHPRDVIDLLYGALQVHTRHSVARLSDQRWRDAAAVLGLLAPLVLLAYSARLPLLCVTWFLRNRDWNELGYLSWYSWPPLVAWAAVVLMAVVGARRVAAGLAWAAVIGELVRATGEYALGLFVNAWPITLAVMAATALTAVALRPGAAVAPWRSGLLASSALLLASAGTITYLVSWQWQWGWGLDRVIRTDWIFTLNARYLEAILLVAGLALGALVVLSLPAPLRRRLLALLAPVGTILLVNRIGFQDWIFLSRPFAGVPVGYDLTQWSALALTPLLTLMVGVAIVHRLDRTPRPLAASGR